jgi:hypothetical protein
LDRSTIAHILEACLEDGREASRFDAMASERFGFLRRRGSALLKAIQAVDCDPLPDEQRLIQLAVELGKVREEIAWLVRLLAEADRRRLATIRMLEAVLAAPRDAAEIA